ncbi:putative methyltransferase-like protein 25 isoform 2-T2 [Sarcophilus harrisii]
MATSNPLPESEELDVLRGKLRELLRFLRKALPIANAHTVDFYTGSLWERFVEGSPDKVMEALRSRERPAEAAPAHCAERLLEGAGESSGISEFSNIFCENSQKLVNVEAFAFAAKYYSLPYFGVCTSLEQLLITFNGDQRLRPGNNVKPDDFMNAKKSHEVQVMSELIGCIADFCGIKQDCIMVGLHTCGDLAANTLRIFTSKSEIKGVCSVGCCYHLLSEKYEKQCKDSTLEMWGFPLCQYLKEEGWCCGRNARMSACLALERVVVGQGLATESLFYRAVLQEIIKECYGIAECDKHVGKVYSKSTSFLDYVRKSLKKLELDDSKLTEKKIMEYYEKYKPRINELEAFNMLKVILAPCIETLILMDRLCYLKEQDNIAWSALVKLFDPVKSPRCYAVIALKKQPCFQVEASC